MADRRDTCPRSGGLRRARLATCCIPGRSAEARYPRPRDAAGTAAVPVVSKHLRAVSEHVPRDGDVAPDVPDGVSRVVSTDVPDLLDRDQMVRRARWASISKVPPKKKKREKIREGPGGGEPKKKRGRRHMVAVDASRICRRRPAARSEDLRTGSARSSPTIRPIARIPSPIGIAAFRRFHLSISVPAAMADNTAIRKTTTCSTVPDGRRERNDSRRVRFRPRPSSRSSTSPPKAGATTTSHLRRRGPCRAHGPRPIHRRDRPRRRGDPPRRIAQSRANDSRPLKGTRALGAKGVRAQLRQTRLVDPRCIARPIARQRPCHQTKTSLAGKGVDPPVDSFRDRTSVIVGEECAYEMAGLADGHHFRADWMPRRS